MFKLLFYRGFNEFRISFIDMEILYYLHTISILDFVMRVLHYIVTIVMEFYFYFHCKNLVSNKPLFVFIPICKKYIYFVLYYKIQWYVDQF